VAFGGAVWVGDGQVSVVVESEFPSAFVGEVMMCRRSAFGQRTFAAVTG
jgi:hypothetical protein